VAIERVAGYAAGDVAAGIAAAVEHLGGWGAFVRAGQRVLVKPNFIAAAPPERPAQTHPVVVAELCRQLIDCGAKPIVADSPAWGSLWQAARAIRLMPMLRRLGVPLAEFNRPRRVSNRAGKVFARFTLDALVLEADVVINLPKLKAHRQLLMTCAIKNMFGCVPGKRKAWWHFKAGNYENYFARMLVEVFNLIGPGLTIIDAIEAMEGDGPIRGQARKVGLLLASRDGAALERVCAEIVGVPPRRLRTLVAAKELGYGACDLRDIELRGAGLQDVRVTGFVLPRLIPIGFSLPRVVRSTLKNAWLMHRPSRRPPVPV